MTVSTFEELQFAALNIVGRDGDTALTDYLPTAIAMVEAKINRRLRVSQMEGTTVGTSTNGVLALPSDFLEAVRVEAYPYGPLEQIPPTQAAKLYREISLTGTCPRYYTIQGNALTTYPAYTGEVTLDYYQKIPALSEFEPSNWLLEQFPDAYLWLTASELEAFAKNPDAALLWNQRGVAALEEIEEQDQSKRFGNLILTTQGMFP